MVGPGAADFDAALRVMNGVSADCVGAQYAAVTVVGDAGSVHTRGATHRYPVWLDAIQGEVGEGPSVPAARCPDPICVNDLVVCPEFS